MAFAAGKDHAGSQTNQINGERLNGSFVKIVDAPNEPAFDITPGAEVLHVQVADGEDGWSVGGHGADFRPNLDPAIKSGPKERKCRPGHLLMLQAKIFLHQRNMLAKPFLETAGGLDDVHGSLGTIVP